MPILGVTKNFGLLAIRHSSNFDEVDRSVEYRVNLPMIRFRRREGGNIVNFF